MRRLSLVELVVFVFFSFLQFILCCFIGSQFNGLLAFLVTFE